MTQKTGSERQASGGNGAALPCGDVRQESRENDGMFRKYRAEMD